MVAKEGRVRCIEKCGIAEMKVKIQFVSCGSIITSHVFSPCLANSSLEKSEKAENTSSSEGEVT